MNRIFFRQKYDYKESVKQLLKDITSLFELDAIILRILNILSNTMFIEDIHIFLHNPDEDAYAEYDPQKGRLDTGSGRTIPSSSPMATVMIEEKREIQRDRFYIISQYTPETKEVLCILESWNAQLILPFITHDKLIGFMMLGNMKSGRYYTISDLEFLRIIADQTAVALKNVHLIQNKIEQEKIEDELKIAGVI